MLTGIFFGLAPALVTSRAGLSGGCARAAAARAAAELAASGAGGGRSGAVGDPAGGRDAAVPQLQWACRR